MQSSTPSVSARSPRPYFASYLVLDGRASWAAWGQALVYALPYFTEGFVG